MMRADTTKLDLEHRATETPLLPLCIRPALVADRFKQLGRRIEIGGLNCGSYLTSFSELPPIENFDQLISASNSELVSDYHELMRGVRRLQVACLKIALSGALKGREINEEKFRDELDLRWRVIDQKRNPTPEESDNLVKFINSFLSEEFKISADIRFVAEEVIEISELFSSMRYGKDIAPKTRSEFLELLEPLRELDIRLSERLIQTELDRIGTIGSSETLEFLSLKGRYRDLFNSVTSGIDQLNWRSPSFNGSRFDRGSECGPSQYVEYGRSDYERWGIRDLSQLEMAVHRMVFRPSDYYEYADTLLFSSAMAAFNTVIELAIWYSTSGRGEKAQPLLDVAYTPDVYFEFNHALARAPTNCTEVVDCSPEGIISHIKTHKPSLLITAPVGLSDTFPQVDIDKLVENFFSPEFKKFMRDEYNNHERLIVLIDDTATGTTSNWVNNDFSGLPRSLKIISLKSLVKNYQDGMDLNFIGALTVIGESTKSDLESLRRRLAALPTTLATNQVILANHRDGVREKIWRHSRNAQIIANEVMASIASIGGGSFLKRVHLPQVPGADDLATGGGQILSLELNYRAFISERDKNSPPTQITSMVSDVGRLYRNIVLALASELNVDINVGTGYGFDRTRFYRMEKSTLIPGLEQSERYNSFLCEYIRVAAGKEPVVEAKLIGRIFARANEIVSELISAGQRDYFDWSFKQRDQAEIFASFPG